MRVATLISLAATWGAVQGAGVVNCQPGDAGCAKCQASCDTINLGALPECCEVYSACCPTYSNQCRSCEANTAVDPHFPEYCCASFTDCCHLVPGLALSPGFSARQSGDVAPSPTTLHAIIQAPQDAEVQASPGRGRLGAPAPPSAVPAPPQPDSPRTRQRSVAGAASGNVRPTPAARKVPEEANVSRRGRVTSRGRVVQ